MKKERRIHENQWQDVQEAIQWIHRLENLGMKPGLARMEWMLERLGHPERKVKYIHVGGTNGKGSVVSFLSHVLQESGFEVGTFTSPYLERFQNRIQVNGEDIADEDLVTCAKQIKPLVDELADSEWGSPTEFEVVTTIAILYFATRAFPDYVIWEVGLGGRLDSTNVVVPLLSIITNIGYDHMNILGERMDQIAAEKAGIIKPGIPVITGTQDEQALSVIRHKAQQKKSTLYTLNHSFHVEPEAFDNKSQTFAFQSMFARYEGLEITLKGTHQIENAGVALMALQVLKNYYATITEEQDMRAGLRKTKWMGRLETLQEQPLVLIDGAHNPEGMAALAQVIDRYYSGRKITVIVSLMQDKPLVDMLMNLNGKVDRLIFTRFDFPRTASVQECMQKVDQSGFEWTFEISGEEEWWKAYQHALQTINLDDVLIITGSLYFVSEVRNRIKMEEDIS